MHLCMFLRNDSIVLFIFFFRFRRSLYFFFFFFNDTATTEIYTLSLHDALPIYPGCHRRRSSDRDSRSRTLDVVCYLWRSEEHTSELQSQSNLVCRLLLEKKKKIIVSFFRDDQILSDFTSSK